MAMTQESARSQGGGAQGARSAEGTGVPGKRTLTEGLPPAPAQDRAGFLHIHGGGYLMGCAAFVA